MNKEITIGKTKIGADNPCFIVAEIGINHDGKYEQAVSLIDAAKKAGANAVKFQLFKAKKMYTEKAGEYLKASGEKGDIFGLIKEAELPLSWIPKLKKYAESRGLEIFLTACDEESADILEKNDISAYKVASYEITHVPLLRHIAKKRKPIFISSAGATIDEIEEALSVFKEEGNNQIVLNHCVAKYPAPLEILNLNVIKDFKKRFPEIVIGYSDHSLDPVQAPKAAVALGAKVIEKHITLNRNLPGADHYCAIEPSELLLMVKTIRETEKKMEKGEKIEIAPVILGSFEKRFQEEEKYIRDFAFRCIFAIGPIKRGQRFTKKNIAVLRTGNQKKGLEPKYYELLVKGYKATRNVKKDKSLDWDDVLSK